MSQSTAPDTERAPEPTAGPHAWRLLVFGPSAVGVHALPSSGSVIIGRGDEAQISIDDPSVSRRHAALDLDGPPRIRDLGSFNGVSVAGRRLAPGEVVLLRGGELLSLGTVAVVVQRMDAAALHGKPRQILSHAYFEARVDEECTRAEAHGTVFAVIRARAPDEAALRDAFAEVLAPTDVVASYSQSELEALLVGEAAARREAVQWQIQERLGSSAVVGLALYGRDGRDADQLIARAGPPTVEPTPGAESMVVRDEVMAQLHALARRVAPSPLPVLLLGETGTGKEIFAEEIHRASSRADKPLLRVNCAALAESLLEAELFGHERGAFTGAVRAREGILEAADGGTVFLDEVGELTPGIQAKLLRAVEHGEIQRVGEARPRHVDVRFICATNRDLDSEVVRGAFRADLLFRLNAMTIVLPPLRERRAEIEPLAELFAARAARTVGRAAPPVLSRGALDLLLAYHWPGNVRELKNTIDRAVVLYSGPALLPEHFPAERLTAPLLRRSAPAPASQVLVSDASGDPERQRILAALAEAGGNQTEAARLLGVSRKTLGVWLDAHGINRPRKGR
jgi:two-component system, NtrC family, response regulator AtoC